MKFKCAVCGAEEDTERWTHDCAQELQDRKLCFNCNHWQTQYEEDQKERGEHNYVICKGIHYVIGPEDDISYFRGFGGAHVRITFSDGTVKDTTNLWCQGDITKGDPHWRELMPDNATMEWL